MFDILATVLIIWFGIACFNDLVLLPIQWLYNKITGNNCQIIEWM